MPSILATPKFCPSHNDTAASAKPEGLPHAPRERTGMGRRRLVKIALGAIALTSPTVACAQAAASATNDQAADASSGNGQSAAAAVLQTAQSPAAGTVPSSPRQGRDPAEFRRFDALGELGATTNWPGSIDTIVGDAGGIRSWLADHDIGIQSRIGTVGVYNPLDTGQPRDPQRYNGQRPTIQTHTFNLIATFGLQSIGLPNSRITVGGNYLITTFRPNGPSTVTFRNLSYYQSFDNKRFEIKLGLIPNYYEFVGLFPGGSPVLSAGVSGLIPIQAGLSADPSSTPAANFTFNMKHGAYVKVGVQRSMSPFGQPYEVTHNGIGLDLTMKGAGPLTIAEFGIRRAATATSRQIWLRAGGIYNDSDYVRFDGRGTKSVQSAYVAGDVQIEQKDRSKPSHGLYVGASAFWGSKEVLSYTQSYELRAYEIGLLRSRPDDTVTVRVGYIKFSPDARQANLARGFVANGSQASGTVSYATHLAPGVILTPAVSYIHNPSLIGDYNDALNLSATVYLLL